MLKTYFFPCLLFAALCNAQPHFQEKWSSEQTFKTDFPPFKAIAKFGEGWLLCGDGKKGSTGQDAFTLLLHAESLLPAGKINWLPLPGNQTVHAVFPENGCWLAGAGTVGNRQGAWLAHINAEGALTFDTLFETLGGGEFWDMLATDSAIFATGHLDGRLAVAIRQKGTVQLFLSAAGTASSEGRSLVQAANGDLLVAGQYTEKKKSPVLKVWHFEPATGRFREIYELPGASISAACKDFTGGVAVAGIRKLGTQRSDLLLVRLEKLKNSPTDSIWLARETMLTSENGVLWAKALLQLPGGSFVVAGGSLGYHPFANCPRIFTAVFNPSTGKSQVQFFKNKTGGIAQAMARGMQGGVLLAGGSGCAGNAGGRLSLLKPQVMPERLPFSSLDRGNALPRVVVAEDSLHLTEQLFDTGTKLPLDKLHVWVNGQPVKIGYRGEKIKPITPFMLSELPSKDVCREFRLDGKIAIRRGMFDTLQLRSDYYESQVQLVYGAPVLHLVAVGNNYDKLAPLQFADDDAREIVAFFKKQKGGSFREVIVDLLDVETEISEEKIAALMANVAAREFAAGDVFVFFMSSHCGVKDGRLLLPYRRQDKYGEFYLDFEKDIFDKIKNLPCRKFVFLDACQASPGNTEVMPVLPDDPGILLATGCELGKKSYEHADWKHGAFTLELLAALQGEAGASLHGVFSTPADIIDYLEKNVGERVKNKIGVTQTPRFYGGSELLGQPFIFHPKK